MNEENGIDLLIEGNHPESIDGYAPQIILSPLTSTFHFQEINHSTFSSILSTFYDILDQSYAFRERWKKFREFFYHFTDKSSSLLIDFYNSAKEWTVVLEPFIGAKSNNFKIGNHWPLFKLLILPSFDEFFQTIAVVYQYNIKIKTNDEDFLNFISPESGKSNVIRKIIIVYKSIFSGFYYKSKVYAAPSNKAKKNHKKTDSKKQKAESTQNIKKSSKNDDALLICTDEINCTSNDTLHEVIIEKRIIMIMHKYFNIPYEENFLYSIPIYNDLFISTGFESQKFLLKDFNFFVRSILKSLPPIHQIFSHLMSAIPVIKNIGDPISFQNDSESNVIIDKLKIRQSKLTFRYFLNSLLIIKNLHSILHIFQAYYSFRFSNSTDSKEINPEILKQVNTIFYQLYKLTKFILKYEENFQLLIRQNILIFLYYVKQLKFLGENTEKKFKITKQENDENDEEEKTYYTYPDDYDTLNPDSDIIQQKDTRNSTKNDQSKNTRDDKNGQNNKKTKKTDKTETDDPALLANKMAKEAISALEGIDDNNLYLKKLKSLIPSIFSTDALANSSSMFASILIALTYKIQLADNIDDYFFQWPMMIDFRNMLEEFSNYAFLYIDHDGINCGQSFVSQMIRYATNPELHSFCDPENMSFLSLFSIYDSALIASPNLKSSIEKEAEEVLFETLERVSKCLIGYNDVDIDTSRDQDQEPNSNTNYDMYTTPKNNVNNRFIHLLKVQAFQMLGKLYQIGSILSGMLNELFIQKIDQILHKSLTEKSIEIAIDHLKPDREVIILMNTRHEFLVANGAILDPFQNMMNACLLIEKVGEIESRVSVSWGKRLVNDIISDFHFNLLNLDFTKTANDGKTVEFNTDKFFTLLKMTPFGGTTYYIKRVLLSMSQEEYMHSLIRSINEFQKTLKLLEPCPIEPYGPSFESQFNSYKNAISNMEIKRHLFEDVFTKMEWFGNHLCMLLMLDLSSQVDQSNHTTLESYLWRSIDASKGKQACSCIFDAEWLTATQGSKTVYDRRKLHEEEEEEEEEVEDFETDKIDNKFNYFERLKQHYNKYKIDNKFTSNEITKLDKKSEVDIDSAFVEGIMRFKQIVKNWENFETVKNRDALNTELIQNMINVMLFDLALNQKEEAINGGFLVCVVALLKALDLWNAFKIDFVIQRLCYQLKIKTKNQKGHSEKTRKSNEKARKNGQEINSTDFSKQSFIYMLFYQLELCDYFI